MEGKKYIKIGRVYRRRKWDTIVVPELRLNGIWLEELGFNIGDKVVIKQNYKSIVISKFDKMNKFDAKKLNPFKLE